jgi:hypothetical protein
MIIPETPGVNTLSIRINYLDDFSQAQVYETSLEINVMDMPMPPMEEMPPGGENPPNTGEQPIFDGSMDVKGSFWAVLGRIVKGLLGVGSGIVENGGQPEGILPNEQNFQPVQ